MKYCPDTDEATRIDKIYERRNYDRDPNYSDSNPIYLKRIQRIERATLKTLEKVGLLRSISKLKVLDFGCGNGRWIGRWLAWGVMPWNITGIDIRDKALSRARTAFSQCEFISNGSGKIPCLDSSFDVVVLNIVISSILDIAIRHEVAGEIRRVLRPGGLIFWCDFTFNNPNNKDVKRVTAKDIYSLFPDFKMIDQKRIILAPPIARLIVPKSWLMAEIMETALPFLCTHIFAVLEKKRYGSA
jgi:ubiquinone/menaquinone biosynthesis C-methylase UbiE